MRGTFRTRHQVHRKGAKPSSGRQPELPDESRTSDLGLVGLYPIECRHLVAYIRNVQKETSKSGAGITGLPKCEGARCHGDAQHVPSKEPCLPGVRDLLDDARHRSGLSPTSFPSDRLPATAPSASTPACCRSSSVSSAVTCRSSSANRWTCSLARRKPCNNTSQRYLKFVSGCSTHLRSVSVDEILRQAQDDTSI